MLTVTLDEGTTRQLERIARVRSVDSATLAQEAIRAHLRAIAQAAMDQEIKAFVRLHPTLLAEIPGEYAAIYQGELVDHDADQLALLARIEEKYSDIPVLIRQVTPLAEPEIRVLSPSLSDG